jgi:hypothetical protein
MVREIDDRERIIESIIVWIVSKMKQKYNG